LLARFEAIVAKSRARPPKILEFGSPKSHFANALASPQPRQANVLFSRALLRHLDADETTAIFAHEVAHLELYTSKRMRFAGWVLFFIIAIGVLFPFITGSAFTAQLVWLFAISVGAVLRRGRRQQRETQCDLRAVELCGDAGALIRGLTKSHELGRIPPRWDAKRARRATHPSLEQRVADITSYSSRTSPGSADIDPARSSAS